MYRWVEHTAELGLVLEAPDREGIFREAFAALAELLSEGAEPGGQTLRVEIAVEAGDGAGLLADWLAELAFLAEMRGLVPEAIVAFSAGETALRAMVAGRIAHPDHLVKAVTYHELALERVRDGGWRGSVVFDV
jgi:SHS2 domain-containing protein